MNRKEVKYISVQRLRGENKAQTDLQDSYSVSKIQNHLKTDCDNLKYIL